jgi:hypothetical protein
MALIHKTLENTDGNKTKAAVILDITPRTLRNKLNKYKSLRSDFGNGIIPASQADSGLGNESRIVEESFSQ